MPTLTNGGILMPILVILVALCWAGMRRMVDQHAHTGHTSPKE